MRVWQYEGRWFYFLKLRGVRVSLHFPNVLGTALRELEPFQIGWRASDETVVRGMAAMGTTQMWQVFAWLAVRPGDVHIEIKGLNLTKRGISPMFFVTSVNWRQRLGKIEAIRHTIEAFKQGEYRPLLTWWLGDGSVKWSFVEKRHYKLRIALSKELKHELSQMLPSYVEAGENYIYISGGKKLFVELVKAAGRYGQLLDVLQPHKWLYLRAVEEPRKKRKQPDYAGGRGIAEYIDVAPGERLFMKLRVVFNEGGSLWATRYFSDEAAAADFAEKLRRRGFEPKIARPTGGYSVYITTRDLKKLIAEREDVRDAVKRFLTMKLTCAKTDIQRKIIEKLMKRLL